MERPRVCTIKLLWQYFLPVFANISHFHPRIAFAGKAGAYQSGAPYGNLLLMVLSAMPLNIIGCKWLTVTKTLAYYDTKLLAAVKSFIVQAPVECTIELEQILKFASKAVADLNRAPMGLLAFSIKY